MTLHRTPVLIAILSVLAAAPCFAQAEGGTHLGKALPPQGPAHADEHIVMPRFPSGWVQQPAQSTGQLEVVEYLPRNQTAATWTDKITLEIHHATNTLPLDAYQGRALGQFRETCDGVIEKPIQTGLNNGFPSAFWILGCVQDKRGRFGEVRYTKSVQGSDKVYLLTRTWRTPPYPKGEPPVPPQQIQEAVAFLSTSVVCADAATHPCPAGSAKK